VHRTVYNSRIPDMLFLSTRFHRVAWALAFLCLFPIMMSATDWSTPSEQLAHKIVAVTGPGAVSLEFTNRSSLAKTDFEEVRRQVLTHAAALGLRFVKAEQAAATVQVSLSENVESYVWVAEIHLGNNESSVVMVSLPRPETANTPRENAPLTIHKTLLWSQEDRILDAAVLEGSPAHLVVLDLNRATLYRFQDSRWQLDQALPVKHSRPWPRDLRGRLIVRKDHLFDAYLPGVYCQSTTTAPLGLNCRDSDDLWPVGTEQASLNAFFSPARNFFTGALTPGIGKQTTAPAFYSAAALPREKYTLWLLATVSGQVHLLDGVSDQTAGKLGWGSDIASVHTGCGSGWQVLATRSGDVTADSVRAFEIADREPSPVSQPLDFNGSITALWTESDGSGAMVVSHNSESGKYDAYRLTFTCGQ
jgi:hypothetical protein